MLFVAVDASQHGLLAFEAFALTPALGRAGTLVLAFGIILVKSLGILKWLN